MLKLAAKISPVLCGIILSLLLAEFFLRFFKPQQTFSRLQAFSFKCFQKGEHRWIKLAADKNCVLRSNVGAFEDVGVKTNSFGLRNPEIKLPKEEGAKRILFIGDSSTMGWGVREEEAFPRVVGNLLSGGVQNIETINGGFTAAGPSGYYLYTKLFSEEIEPDILVVGFYLGNDVTARQDVEWTKVDAQGLPDVIRSKSSYVDATGTMRKSNTEFKYRFPYLSDSHLFVFVVERFSKVESKTVFDPVISPLVCLYKKFCHDMDAEKGEVRRLFKGMNELAEKRGKRLLVVMIPTEFQIYQNVRPKYGITIPLLPSEKRYPNEEFGRFFREDGVEYLDLLPILVANQDKRVYFELDDHWNPQGHAIAAEAISSKLSEMLKN